MKRKVLVVDDHSLFRSGLIALLSRLPEIAAQDGGATVQSARSAIDEVPPDAVVLDLRLPDGDARDLLLWIRNRVPACFVLVVSAYLDDATREECRLLGADACLDKTATAEEFRAELQSAKLVRELRKPDFALTPLEARVLELLAAGHSNKEIASALGTTPGTIKNYIGSVLQKLDCPRRGPAIVRARLLGLLL